MKVTKVTYALLVKCCNVAKSLAQLWAS